MRIVLSLVNFINTNFLKKSQYKSEFAFPETQEVSEKDINKEYQDYKHLLFVN